MSKVNEWEYDDRMQDYLQWKDELERLLKEEEIDEEEIKRVENTISDYKEVLFG